MLIGRKKELQREPIYSDEEVKNIYGALGTDDLNVLMALEKHRKFGLNKCEVAARSLLSITESVQVLDQLQGFQLVSDSEEGIYRLNGPSLTELISKAASLCIPAVQET